MGYFSRHVLAVIALPVTVVVVVPLWLARRFAIRLAPPQTSVDWVVAGAGLATFIVGSILFLASLRRFGGEGNGTLAPWDPPKNLVIRGPYSFVRNPMISGVFLVLVSEGMLLRSSPHLGWALVFGCLNALYIPLLEEPGLRTRFGHDFEEYARHVPRLVPRLTPWRRQ
jgi:protein-S-isoprenylcysteine O-methyltransferase Ste14